MSIPTINQNQVNSPKTATSHEPNEENLTVSAHHSRKRKKRDEEVSDAFRTNVLRPSSSSSNPLPSTSISSTFAATPHFNAQAGLDLPSENGPSNIPPMLPNHVPMVNQMIIELIYGAPLPWGGFMFTNRLAPVTLAAPLPLNPDSAAFPLYPPITVIPQPMFFAQRLLSFPSPMISTTSQYSELPANTHYDPSFHNTSTASEISEVPGLERKITQPVAISTHSEKSEQLSTLADTISGKDVKRFFQEQGIAYTADVLVDPIHKDRIAKIWKARPRLESDEESIEGKACREYLDKVAELDDDFSLKTLEIRKISIKLQNGETVNDYGVFATEAIKENTIIGIYAGKLKPLKEINDNDYAFSLPKEGFGTWAIDGKEVGNITRFINHSSEEHENVSTLVFYEKMTVPRVMFIVGEKAINKGNQLLYDYGDEYWNRKKITPTILLP